MAAHDGGGVRLYGAGTFNLDNTSVSGNQAGDDGGGISNNGTATVTVNNGSQIDGNSTTGTYVAGLPSQGGGIFNSGGVINVYGGSSVDNNTAYDDGGGIFNTGINGDVNLTASSASLGRAQRAGP